MMFGTLFFLSSARILAESINLGLRFLHVLIVSTIHPGVSFPFK